MSWERIGPLTESKVDQAEALAIELESGEKRSKAGAAKENELVLQFWQSKFPFVLSSCLFQKKT